LAFTLRKFIEVEHLQNNNRGLSDKTNGRKSE
jgi:hypothetical protein